MVISSFYYIYLCLFFTVVYLVYSLIFFRWLFHITFFFLPFSFDNPLCRECHSVKALDYWFFQFIWSFSYGCGTVSVYSFEFNFLFTFFFVSFHLLSFVPNCKLTQVREVFSISFLFFFPHHELDVFRSVVIANNNKVVNSLPGRIEC